MKDAGWEKIYESGVLTGKSKERVRILEIIQKRSANAGSHAVALRTEASIFRDETESCRQRNILAEIAEYEQKAYVQLMKEINEDDE